MLDVARQQACIRVVCIHMVFHTHHTVHVSRKTFVDMYVHHCLCTMYIHVYMHVQFTKCCDNCGSLSLIISENIVAQV